MRERNFNLTLIVCSILIFSILGCTDGGTHGTIKSYQFNTTKYKLERVVDNVFAENMDFLRKDTVKDYYNDDSTYITFHILKDEIENEYVIRYYGKKADWDSSKMSSIFIAYAYTKDRRGGSAGNDGLGKFDNVLRKELIDPVTLPFFGLL